MTTHTDRQYEEELNDLRQNILTMGGLVEKQIGNAIEALVNRDHALAEAIIRKDAGRERARRRDRRSLPPPPGPPPAGRTRSPLHHDRAQDHDRPRAHRRPRRQHQRARDRARQRGPAQALHRHPADGRDLTRHAALRASTRSSARTPSSPSRSVGATTRSTS